jgi:hypothetical protein
MSKKKKKDQGGRLAANFRNANIAEGLAIQMFRSFAAIAPIPREEDYGIDFIGTLIRKEGKALVAEDSFLVQVKVATSPIFSFSGDGVNWLRNLKLPYFPVVVDLTLGMVSVYSLNKFHRVIYPSLVNTYNFVIQNEHCDGDGLDDFPLDDPIMQWTLNDCTHPDFSRWAYSVLKPFVIIEAGNFRYGHLWRFEQFTTETFRFTPGTADSIKINTDVITIPPGNGEVTCNILKEIIGPFANWVSNQTVNDDKGDELLKLRDALRGLSFDPDPENTWDQIASRMSTKT